MEQYDIVHIQLFQLGIQNRDPEPIVQNLIRMLSSLLTCNLLVSRDFTDTLQEPGGWISWGEYDYSHWKTIQTSDKPDTEIDVLTTLLDYVGTIGGTRPNWAQNL